MGGFRVGDGVNGLEFKADVNPKEVAEFWFSDAGTPNGTYLGTLKISGSASGIGVSSSIDVIADDTLTGVNVDMGELFLGLQSISGKYAEVLGFGNGYSTTARAGFLVKKDGIYLVQHVDAKYGLLHLGSVGASGLIETKLSNATFLNNNDECFLADTSIRMWPRDPSIKPRLDGSYDEELVLSKVWHKPISEIAVGDIIVAYDKQGRLQPDRVTRTMQNNATHILDFWGTGVTPGHACYCADGPFKGEHAPIMDILRTDTAMMRTDGTMFRAATNCEVGSIGDRMVHAEASVQKTDGSWTPKKRGQIRFGTRISTPDGKQSVSVMEIAEQKGWSLSDDGYMIGKIEGEDGTLEESKFPFPYNDSAELPKPEDYILTRSQVTLEDIYKAGEWEQIGTRMPAPASMVGFNPNTTSTMLQPSKPKPNLPPAFANRSDVLTSLGKAQRPAKAAAAPSMNRKQRKAMEANQRKAAKARRRLAS